MKNTDEIMKGLRDADSGYYAGSACFMSLIAVLKSLRKEMLFFDEAFEDIFDVIDRLIVEDGRYFELSLKKEGLSDEEWKEVMAITSDYAILLDTLNEMKDVLLESGLGRYVPFLQNKFVLLSHLCQSSLASFYEMERKPEEFFQVANGALTAIRG